MQSMQEPTHLFYGTRRRRPQLARAEGVYIRDVTGKRYLDGSSGAMVCNIGHGNPAVLAAMRGQMEVATFGYRLHVETEPSERLAARLAGIAPGDLNRVFFVSGGSEAVGSAMKAGNPLACAAGLAVLDEIERQGMMANAVAMGDRLATRLRALMQRHAIIGDMRGMGRLQAFELVSDRVTMAPLGAQRGARFEYECYDSGHLTMLRHFKDRGLVAGPLFIQFVFGVLGGMAALPENLTHMVRLADGYFGDDDRFSVLAAGRHQIPTATMAAAMGGHVRVGLEDNLFAACGVPSRSNAEHVTRIREIAEGLGRPIATPTEVWALLGLKVAAHVGF